MFLNDVTSVNFADVNSYGVARSLTAASSTGGVYPVFKKKK